jgi:glycerol-3-phosphate dehydrogenase
LGVPAERLIGGTKGSHFFTFHDGLRQALSGRGLYGEAVDGRPIFITPLGDTILVGTTDEPYEADPSEAVAGMDELNYLLGAVNHIMPQLNLKRNDIAFSYSGVRPLPYVDAATPGAITRRHSVRRYDSGGLPCYTIVGGKLTTCRSLAEQTARQMLADLGLTPRGNSRERVIPGGENYPSSESSLIAARQVLEQRFALSPPTVAMIWSLYGTRSEAVLAESMAIADRETGSGQALVADTCIPAAVVRWMIRYEWARTLDDLVERRLMLLFNRQLTRRALAELAQLLAAEGCLDAAHVESAVTATIRRLHEHFGRWVSVRRIDPGRGQSH